MCVCVCLCVEVDKYIKIIKDKGELREQRAIQQRLVAVRDKKWYNYNSFEKILEF